MSPGPTLRLLEGSYAVGQLEPSSPIPSWAEGEGFVSISRTKEELSVVCREDRVPPAVKTERGWRCLEFQGPFDFSLSGILASVLGPLAEARIGIFAVSTYNTDYLLVNHPTAKAGGFQGQNHAEHDSLPPGTGGLHRPSGFDPAAK